MTLEQAERAYREDPTFRAVVMMIRAGIERMDYTPQEVRAAAMLASIQVDRERRHFHFIPTEGHHPATNGEHHDQG